MQYEDSVPIVQDAWVAPNATLVGDVNVSKWATIWYNAVLRAEFGSVRIGHFSTIGTNVVLNANVAMPVNVPNSVTVGKNV